MEKEFFEQYIANRVESFRWLMVTQKVNYSPQFVSNQIRDEFKRALQYPERCTFQSGGKRADYTPEVHKSLGGYKGLDKLIKELLGE